MFSLIRPVNNEHYPHVTKEQAIGSNFEFPALTNTGRERISL